MAITYPHSNPPKYSVGTYPGGTEGYTCPSPTYAVGTYPGGTGGYNSPSPKYKIGSYPASKQISDADEPESPAQEKAERDVGEYDE